jgi:hypothetical protein
MANLTDTQKLAAIVTASNSLKNSTEFRDYEHSAVKVLLDGEQDLFRDLNRMKTADSQATKVALNKKVYTASGTAKSATHAAAAFADSFMKDITYTRLTQTFKISYKQADMNILDYGSILEYELKNKLQSLYADLSAAQIAWLNTNRSQVGDDGLMVFDGAGFQYDNVLADKDVAFDYIKATQRLNKYNGSNTVGVVDQRMAAHYRKMASNGRTNADNTEFQLPGVSIAEEPQMAIGADSTGFFWEKGLVGMTTWNEAINRRGEGSFDSNSGLFSTMREPVFGMLLDLHAINSVADTSGAAGNVQDKVDEYEISLTYATEGSWESTANASHIFKVVQANS